MKSNSPAISPFKFLDSYRKEDKDIFFGRSREISEIHSKIYQSKLLLIYGASGTGKSSIINCGLANRLADTDWLPVPIRRGGDISNSMLKQLQKQTVAEQELKDESSTEAFHGNLHKVVSNVFLDHFKPIYLIFDQFEELFIFGFKEEWLKFIHAVRYLMDTDLDVHFVFVIRGEYLEFLSEFEDTIPEFFDNRVRIEKMTRSMARESITGPSQLFSINLDESFEDNLLKKLSPDKSQIELTFLQVILDKIYRNAVARQGEQKVLSFTNDDIEEVGQIGDILAEFVDEQLFKMSDSKAALTVLKGFVSLEGTKTQKNIDEIVHYCDDIGQTQNEVNIEAIITSFVNKRILKEKDDNGRYELRHDSLAQKIFEKITNQEKELLEVRRFISYNFDEYQKRNSILNDDDLSYIAPYERLLNLDPAQKEFIEQSRKRSSKRRQAQRRRSIIIAIISLLMITSIIGFGISQQQRKRAESLAKLAEIASEKAMTAQLLAEEQRQLAALNAKEAQKQAALARNQADRAFIARDLARQQELEAGRQKSIAEDQRQQAEVAKQIALNSEQEAIIQRTKAEARRLEAEKLRMLTLSRELALKSIYMVDKERKALLSKVSFDLNKEFGGSEYAPNIYRSLYLANKELKGDDFNVVEFQNKEIVGLIKNTSTAIVATSDGIIYTLKWQGMDATSSEMLQSGIRISSLDYSDSGAKLLIGGRDGSVLVIDSYANIDVQVSLTSPSPVVKIINLNSGKKLIGQKDGALTILDDQGEKQGSTLIPGGLNDLTLYAEDMVVLAMENGNLVTVDNDLQIVEENSITNQTGLSRVINAANSSDLIIGTKNGEIFSYNLKNREITGNLIGHTSGITDLEISVQHNLLLTSSFDRSVRLWDLNNFRSQSILLSIHERWATSVGFDPIERYAYSTSYGGKVKKYPLDHELLENDLCDLVGRSLNQEEWLEFIGTELSYQTICK